MPPSRTESDPQQLIPGIRSSVQRVNNPDTDYALLRRFDTIFLIDDSSSMRGQNWNETLDALVNISPICTKHDQDGIDIYFLKHRNPRDTQGAFRMVSTPQSVETIFGSVYPHGDTPIGARLKEILEPYMEDLAESLRHRGTDTDSISTVKPINIIVITDGRPTDGLENDLVATIVATAKQLDNWRADEWQVGIQFFQVGRDKKVTEYLRYLDDDLREAYGVRDIIDTVTWDKDPGELSADTILKVVLGAVHRKYDRQVWKALELWDQE
ncbi:hypothetical protein BDV38DRAFT_276895 [Aspergillus pseudotamarii]|uniref:VWFA domain-containing protein n=1 Tax=Aspergillus pseudotamarii TaxID=132259 RepID=A0A5N6TBS4_ASPPS|nr:uncharacterized protein BDV38DRAFT_276895 [Aspergillus pseudotamarii]KAE8143825.1 hypothetical protein BDV38DRAFT_276895 [Aspergillus pseudotamarii]